jgi:class 3 adenylate cyclase/predicted ATPase
MSDLGRWLDGLGLGQYAAAFAEDDVDWDVLAELDEADLEKLGLSLGHRKKLLKAIAGLAGEGERPAPAAPAVATDRPPKLYTPKHLADRILSSRDVLEGERKRITVLFADIKGSLELIQGDDPERVQALLDSVVSAMIEAVHRYEGTVNKVLGDGIMALFGAPLAHEDHAARACFAALAMQETVRRTAEETRRKHGVEMQIRVGLNSGEVVVRAIGNDLSMDYDAIGQTTHLAGRMEQLAIPGTIRLTADTLQMVEGLVRVDALGPMPIKGLAEPIEVFELLAATPTRARFRAAVARGLSRFVGRDTELDALNRALARAAGGQGQIAAVVGEPGVGKSRLFYEFTHSHRTQGWLILESGSVSYGKATAYLPLIDLLKNYFRIEDRDELRSVREKVTGKLLALDEALAPILVPLLALLDVPVDDTAWDALDPPQRRRRTLDGVKGLLLRESRIQPLILMFEDLHWIDSETQAFLDSLVEALPAARILLMVNYRPEYGHDWGGRTYYTQRRIDPLGPESASELLSALLGDDASVAPLARILIERTGGNPFFLEESVRSLLETGAIAGASGAYRMTGDIEQIEVPATVQGILAARIDRLDVKDKRLLQTASVIGKDVPFELLKAIADTGDDALRRGLANLGTAEFLYETHLFPDLEYTFKHALTHEVAYGTLLQEQRRGLHRRIAEAIEAIHGARLTENFERLAHHYTEAGLAVQAIGYWQQAGQRAIERSANTEAIGLLERGLRVIETLPESPDGIRREIAFRVALGVPLMTKKGVASPEAEQNYLRARALCEEVGDNTQLFPVLWGLWMGLQTRSQLHQACEIADQLLAVGRAVDDSTLRLQAHHCQWTSRFLRGELPAALEHTEQGMALYRPDEHHASANTYGGHDPGTCARNVGAFVLWLLGRPKQAQEWQDAAVALSRDLGHPLTLFDTLTNHLHLSVLQRDPGAILRNAEAVLNFPAGTEEMKFMHNIEIANGARGCVLADRGEDEAGLALIRNTVTQMRDFGVSWTVSVLSLIATTLARHGDPQEALELVTETLASMQRDDARWWEAELHRVQGEILLTDGPNASDRAEACFQQALDVARNQEARSLELRAGTSLARLWLGQDKLGEARDLLAPIYGWFTEGFENTDLKDAKALLQEVS